MIPVCWRCVPGSWGVYYSVGKVWCYSGVHVCGVLWCVGGLCGVLELCVV